MLKQVENIVTTVRESVKYCNWTCEQLRASTEGMREREMVIIVFVITLDRLGGTQSGSRRDVQRKSLVLPANERGRPTRDRYFQHSLVGQF
jgi:hypothetical protein